MGAILQGFASQSRFDQALRLFELVDSGAFDVNPGATCYNGLILAYVKSRSWNEALQRYEEMKARQVQPMPATNHGILLASYKVGGEQEAFEFLQSLVKSDALLTLEGLFFATKLFIPELADEKASSLDGLRKKLRKLNDLNALPDKDSATNLIRALRVCEVANSREPSKNLTRADIDNQRRQAWSEVLLRLTTFAAHRT